MEVFTTLIALSLVGICSSYSCSPAEHARTLCRLEATGDVWLESTRNNNNRNFLIVGKHADYPLKRSLLVFENIPSTCQKVRSATMHIHYWYGYKPGFHSELQAPWVPRPIEARQVLKSWNETQATRDMRLADTPWTPYYMNLSDVDARSNADDTHTIDRHTPRGYISWNITTTAWNWLNGQPNYGIVLLAANENVLGRDIRFYSRESTPEKVPYIDVLCKAGVRTLKFDTRFEVGQGVEVEYTTPSSGAIRVNFFDAIHQDIILLFKMKYNFRLLVLNTRVGSWGREEQFRSVDFTSGRLAKVKLVVCDSGINVYFNGNFVRLYYYRHGHTAASIKYVDWVSDQLQTAKLESIKILYNEYC